MSCNNLLPFAPIVRLVIFIVVVVVVHVFDVVIVDPRNLSLKVGQNRVINRRDLFVGIVVVVVV